MSDNNRPHHAQDGMRILADAMRARHLHRPRPKIDSRIESVIRHHYPHAEVGFNAIQAKIDEFGDRLCMRHGVVMADQAESRFVNGQLVPGSRSVHFSNYLCSMCSNCDAQPLALTFTTLLAEFEGLITD
jgi:hypothetical protein